MSLTYCGIRIDDLIEREKKVREGLRFIIKHLDDSMPVWKLGRWISTYVYTNSGKEQKFRKVFSEDEALLQFKLANFLDCRIRGYHAVDDKFAETNMTPSLSLVDVDREYFNTVEEFELAANRTYENFIKMLDARPTQLWTGNGYHFVNPQLAIILEKVERFKKFRQPSVKFLRFEEELLTNGKADQNHINNISFGNCMLRVLGSLNSNQVQFDDKGRIMDIPPEAEVRIAHGRYWDGCKPSIKPLLPECYIWLQDAVERDLDRQTEIRKYWGYKGKKKAGTKNTIGWIENLLNTPLDDFRKYLLKFILAPYLTNKRGLSRSDTFDSILTWLNNCDSVCKLRFNIDRKINEALDSVADFLPQGREKLKHEFPILYTRLEEEGIVY
jgi:hypothetical protein